MTENTPCERKLRKDALANRERLLAAGRELFARHGLDVTLNDVAHHAGVGVGTAYRRFANKEELIDAISQRQNEEMIEILHQALGMEDAWDGLVFYLEESLKLQTRDRMMAQIFAGQRIPKEQYDAGGNQLAPLVNQVAERAREAGELREEITGTDLIFLQIALTKIALVSRGGELYRRYLWIALDGMRVGNVDAPLPVAALTTEETHELLRPAKPVVRTDAKE